MKGKPEDQHHRDGEESKPGLPPDGLSGEGWTGDPGM
jgi:hypothetical protein